MFKELYKTIVNQKLTIRNLIWLFSYKNPVQFVLYGI